MVRKTLWGYENIPVQKWPNAYHVAHVHLELNITIIPNQSDASYVFFGVMFVRLSVTTLTQKRLIFVLFFAAFIY